MISPFEEGLSVAVKVPENGFLENNCFNLAIGTVQRKLILSFTVEKMLS